jgi:hypothetical protein
MMAYAIRYGARKLVLLYPMWDEDKDKGDQPQPGGLLHFRMPLEGASEAELYAAQIDMTAGHLQPQTAGQEPLQDDYDNYLKDQLAVLLEQVEGGEA